ncbi:MAG: CRISPR system precrRNA processing endoribonuclease RAMP protein Cas6 [Methanobacteriota archaeon]|nr:MAG: CRISPR system precrRNA processing endoribonuclease RAMP protein Cas6 [Euryarchaeota archaeon]
MDVARFHFLLRTQNSFGLPEFKGSTFRGKFGHVLKRTICVVDHRNCSKCALQNHCAYIYLFESKNERGQTVPRPFVLEPPLTRQQFFLRDKILNLNLVLIGKAIDFLPYFIYCFERMGEEGIGQDKGHFIVQSVFAVDEAGEKHEIYNHDTQTLSTKIPRIQLEFFKSRILPQATLHFYTPTDIRVNEQRVHSLEFPQLLKSILRRYRSLRFYHGDCSKERFEINWKAAEKIEIVHQKLEHRRFKRYSNRQKRPIALQGFTGRITYRGDLGQFYPWLKIGELLHVGKNTVFGMGGYKIIA